MKHNDGSGARRGRTYVLVLAVGFAAIGAASVRALLNNRMVSIAPVPVAVVAPDRPVQSPMEAEIITITGRGFEPGEITRPRGGFLLAVDNRSGLPELSLRLDRETGQNAHAVRVTRKEQDWRGELDLEPGRYVLTAEGHLEWVCRINITAK